MYKTLAAVLILILIACACETTSRSRSEKNAQDGPIEVKVGGSVVVQGEYQGSN